MAARTALMTPAFGRVLDEFPDAVVAMTTDGRIVYWSKGAELIFGHSSAEAVGCDMRELLVPPDRIGEENRLLQEALAGETRAYQALRRTKTGSLVYVDITSKAVWNDRGDVDFVLSIKKDVTARKVAQDAKLVEGRFGELLEAMPDAVLVVNASGRIVACNRRAEQLFRYQPLELRGQPVETLLPERHRGSHIEQRWRFFQRPRARPMGVALDLLALCKDGTEFPAEISLNPLETDEGTLISSAIRDITERKRFECALQEKSTQLEKASRARDEWVVNVSRELRQPIGVILSTVNALLASLPGPFTVDQENQLKLIQAHSTGMLSALDGLLPPPRSETTRDAQDGLNGQS